MDEKQEKTQQKKLVKAITNVENTLDLLDEMYAERPYKPTGDAIVTMQGALRELKKQL